MDIARVVFGIAWAPLLSGWMAMGGMGHVDGMEAHAGQGSRQAPARLLHAEASNGGLTLALSLPSPSSGVAVAVEARLRADGARHERTEETVWLRIEAPDQSVEVLRMQLVSRSTAGTYRVPYAFPSAGVYVLTAEGQVGADGVARTVSVTTNVEVGSRGHGVGHVWHAPLALLGGFGMVALMALMMAGSGS